MTREVQGIPPAPRRVHLRKALGYRWPLAAAALVLAVYGGVLTWMVFLANGGKALDGRRLDTEPTDRASAIVTGVEPGGRIDADTPADRVSFKFDYGGHRGWTNESFVARGTFDDGDTTTVELLPGEPHICRLVGGYNDLIPGWLRPGPWFVVIVVPGLLAGLGYLAGVFHLHRVLVHGDVTVAQVLSVRRVPFCLPETWSVRFSFRDHHARERISRHWVRAHSPIGARLQQLDEHGTAKLRVPVLHDRRWPQYCRLVVAGDFAARPEPDFTAPLPD